ncbi:hypothetical protein ACFQMA_02115 [Halosimplex aquaticum]|uniref:Uncharacterized protein n=1 Tax=Halosimplex aquaticum TaxID=3026162 RepID=A0ABD5XU20_9EURY|nr:hypothetical protein [Halosimplex aquaticum]
MRVANVVTAPLAGVVVVTALAPVVPVALTLLLGAAVATAVTWRADTRLYGLVGALYLLTVGTAVLASGRFPLAWQRTPLVALWGFGLLSLSVFCLRVALGVVGRRLLALFVSDESAASVWEALSAFGETLVVAWYVLTAHEKAVRSGGVVAGTAGTTVLDAAGYDLPILAAVLQRHSTVTLAGREFLVPLWALRHGIDATVVLFVGCLIVGFHTLGTFAAMWRAITEAGDYAAEKTEAGAAAAAATDAATDPVTDGTDRTGGSNERTD